MRILKLVLTTAALATVALFGSAAPLGSAASDRAVCTYGDMQAMFTSLEVIYGVQMLRGIENNHTRKLYAPVGGPCQYRLWAGPALSALLAGEAEAPVQTFQAEQWFLGGSVWFWDYKNWKITRRQAVDDLKLIEEHLYLIPADDDWSFDPGAAADHERTLRVTPFRDSVDAEGTLLVSRQKAIIDQLPAGRYVSWFTVRYPGNPELQALHPDDPEWVAVFSAFESDSVVYLDIVQ
jgi:hypothetical protein